MANAEYFRRQADTLEKLAESLRDRLNRNKFQAMSADFRARAKELEEEEENLPAYMVRGSGSSDGEMDRD